MKTICDWHLVKIEEMEVWWPALVFKLMRGDIVRQAVHEVKAGSVPRFKVLS